LNVMLRVDDGFSVISRNGMGWHSITVATP